MILLNTIHENELLRILNLINENEMSRMGKLFNTDLNNYFYDTGTGKVIILDDEAFYIMNLWFTLERTDLNDFLNTKYLKHESLLELLDICLSEHLLSAIKPKTFYSPYYEKDIEKIVNTKLEQLILEVTGKCNLRCGYCIYNEEYDKNRNFNSEDMTEEVAIKAVDYFYEHSTKNMAITFYGGEPLLRFELLKATIDYSLKKNQEFQKELTFGFTTNLTLVTKEISEYLATVPGLNILCSMDGPEIIHNAYRKYANGEGSFKAAMNGLKLLCEAFKKNKQSNSNYPIAINVVAAPPYTYDKFDQINDFFSNLDFLPKDVNIKISYAIDDSVDDKEYLTKFFHNPKYRSSNYEDVSPLWKWQTMKIKEQKKVNDNSIVGNGFGRLFKLLSNRHISDEPNDIYHFNACCIPGVRRLYVNTKGEFLPCERIGTCPDIGNIDNGISIEKIKKYYIDDYADKSITGCSNCWSIRLCGLCYAGRYDKTGLKYSKCECESMRRLTERYLSFYHELLETDKDILNVINEIEIG